MTTDTKAVARWDLTDVGENTDAMLELHDGDYVLFTDHERVVGELQSALSASRAEAIELDSAHDDALFENSKLRAEVEGLRAACSGSAYTLFLDAYYKACETCNPSDWHNAAMLAKQWEQQIDAVMEKGNV